VFSEWLIPGNASLKKVIDQSDLEFADQEATGRLLMKLSSQLHLAGLSLLNTI